MTILAVYILTVACLYAVAMFVIIRIAKRQKKFIVPKAPISELRKHRLDLAKQMEKSFYEKALEDYQKAKKELAGKNFVGIQTILNQIKEQQMDEENLRNIEPLGDKVLVEIDAAPDKTESGLFLPGNKHDRFGHNGTVVAAGPDAKGTVKKGDRVLVMKYSGTEMNSRSRLFMMKLDDILAVVEP